MGDYPTDDTRGIVDPAGMMRHVHFARHDPGEALDGLVEWFWSVSWHLPDGDVHDQYVLNHPAGNVSVGTLDDRGVPLHPAEGRVYGVHLGLSLRRLTSSGWTVAARTTVGGLGVLIDRPARSLAGRQLALGEGIPSMAASVVRDVTEAEDNETRVDLLRHALAEAVAGRDRVRVEEARQVCRVASLAERDRSVRRVEQLAEHAGVSVRTLQRLFDHHVGISPAFVIKRWRIIEAVEEARLATEDAAEWRGWAEVAAELGYADQAHLTRDFTATLGVAPGEYLDRIRPGPGGRASA